MYGTFDPDKNPFTPETYDSPFKELPFLIADAGGNHRIRNGAYHLDKAEQLAKSQSFFRPVIVYSNETKQVLAEWDNGKKLV